jgi:hypothetical protein
MEFKNQKDKLETQNTQRQSIASDFYRNTQMGISKP